MSTGVWEIEPMRSSQYDHPCVYPDELVDRLIRMFSYVGDRVLDPFLGSGTTVKVARELGREGIGYERELMYKPVIMKRLGVEAGEVPDAEGLETTMANIKEALPTGVSGMDLDVDAVASEEDAAAKAFAPKAELPEVEQ